MPRPAPLGADELDAFLTSAPDWSVESGELVRRVTAGSFTEAIGWVVAVANAAERDDHHPDIDIRWRTLVFRLHTHDVGAVTRLDTGLALEIDRIVSQSS
jgi:4a-hydroxytetrahydrobiopterin dehydratase